MTGGSQASQHRILHKGALWAGGSAMAVVNNTGLEIGPAWVQILTLPLIHYETSVK